MDKEKSIEDREQALAAKLEKLQQMEKEIREKEKFIKQNEKSRKQVILRIAPSLWEEISRWADEDFRSINGQIEFLLTECINKRKK